MGRCQKCTKEKIIDIAGDIFGKNGFRATTIRMIANAANVNVAAVNYHFGDKESLYAEVLEDIFHTGFTRFPSAPGVDEKTSPEEQLKVFIRAMLYRLLSQEGWGGLEGKAQIIARAMLEPTPVFAKVIEKYIVPHKDIMLSILSKLVDVGDEPERMLMCVVSILGQCIYYVYATAVIQQIASEFGTMEANIDRIADHVFEFSMGGLEKINRNKEGA